MRITDVRISRRNDDKLKAFASVTFEDSLVVHGFKVIQGHGGLFVGMPSRRRPDGRPRELFQPVHERARRDLARAVLAAYHDDSHPPDVMARLVPPLPVLLRRAARPLPGPDAAPPPLPRVSLPLRA